MRKPKELCIALLLCFHFSVCQTQGYRNCLDENGSNYRGDIDVTRTGIACEQWTTKFAHGFFEETGVIETTTETMHDKGLGNHAHCRNPDNDGDGPWCIKNEEYVREHGDEQSKWDYCEVPECVCDGLEFQCPDDHCIGLNRICDGESNCSDGSDERDCPDDGEYGFIIVDSNGNPTVGPGEWGLVLFNEVTKELPATVCRYYFNNDAAEAICHEMGYSGFIQWSYIDESGERGEWNMDELDERYVPLRLDDESCVYKDWSLCSAYPVDFCGHNQDVILMCEGETDHVLCDCSDYCREDCDCSHCYNGATTLGTSLLINLVIVGIILA